jgi:hypothetical protein
LIIAPVLKDPFGTNEQFEWNKITGVEGNKQSRWSQGATRKNLDAAINHGWQAENAEMFGRVIDANTPSLGESSELELEAAAGGFGAM